MSETFHVRIAKAEHVFSAAHFITFDEACERLHGHNYHVAAEVYGTLDDNRLVVDFLLVREKLRGIVAYLDHYVLFPNGDCRLLPMANTTAEMLAAYIGHELREALKSSGIAFDGLRIEVDECDGQIAVWQQGS
jgi:6-pyruvoyltetrahydropterin/6-carboxytetrahydropterin synthase